MTTANLRIVPRNFHDEATVTTSSAATGFDVTNTQNTARDTVWRSAVSTTTTVSGTFSRNRVVNFFGMFRHRNHGGSIRVQLYSDAAWTTQVDDTGTVAINKIVGGSGDTAYAWGDDPYGAGQYDPLLTDSPYWFWFATSRTIRSYKATFSSISSTYWPGTYWQASRFWVGLGFEVAINPVYGAALGWQDETDRNRTRGGSLRTNLGAKWKTIKWDFDAIAENEVPVWLDILANAQTGKDIVVSLFPNDGTRKERDHIIAAKLSALDPIGRQVNRLTHSMQAEEI